MTIIRPFSNRKFGFYFPCDQRLLFTAFIYLKVFCRHGKTTLLQHIANRQLAIPPKIDVLLCEQEVMADATPAVDVVLRADTKRLELLELEKSLTAQSSKGDLKATEKLRGVYEQLSAIGADSAEARARR